MSDIKTKVQGLDPNVHARDLNQMERETSNIYETLAIISKRARQLQADITHQLHSKLEEVAVSTDTVEEIKENKEQIENEQVLDKVLHGLVGFGSKM